MMIEFKINGFDISNDVILNSVNYMNRTDEVFGTGSFQFESKTYYNNIPPYSVLIMNGVYYCCSSEATYHYGRGSWFHNVSIIEATSLLSRFLVGSKAFSITGTNIFDWRKLDILIGLVNDKYNVNIKIDNNYEKVKTFNKHLEYVFTAGTTLFDALNEISKQYNVRFYVSKIEDTNIDVSFVKLDQLETLTLNEDKLLSETKTQNAETYCKFLESEATNVIDTNQPIQLRNLFAKSNDIQLNENTFLLELPTAIYKINKLEAVMEATMNVWLEFTDWENEWLPENFPEGTIKTYRGWAGIIPQLDVLYNEVFGKYHYYIDFYDTEWGVQYYDGNWALRPANADAKIEKIGYVRPLNVLSKEKYDLLLDKDKPDYVYYEMGSNKIDGFNIFYKNNFWNTILGKTNDPVMLDRIVDTTYDGYESGSFKIRNFMITNLNYTYDRPLNSVFNVEYYPMINPYLVAEKYVLPTNESEYKPYAISYNKSSNYVDFDKISNSMKIENDTMGKVEMIVEYESNDLTFMLPFYKKVNLKGYYWYIESCNTTFNGTQQITTFNLVKNYNKTADVIGLNSQYNTLKNPLENIIERPIYLKTDKNIEYEQGITYLRFDFQNSHDIIISSIVLPAIVVQSNDDIYLYCEMQDQYSAGKKAVYVNNDNYKLTDVPYVDENNEAFSVDIYIVKTMKDIYYTDVLKFPEYSNNLPFVATTFIDNLRIFKDAREKLTFTIKANNCIIK